MNKKGTPASTGTLKKKMWEGLFNTEKCQLIKVEGIIELEKRHFANTNCNI